MTTAEPFPQQTAISTQLSSRMDAGLLVLRATGLFLAATFGAEKVFGYIALIRAGQPLATSGLAPLIHAMGLPAPGFLGVCTVLNESLGALFIAAGFLTRPAAAIGATGMSVAFYVSMRLHEEPLRAALYAVIFVTIAIAGPGRFSVDYLLSRQRGKI